MRELPSTQVRVHSMRQEHGMENTVTAVCIMRDRVCRTTYGGWD